MKTAENSALPSQE